jgi:hypothetical protein
MQAPTGRGRGQAFGRGRGQQQNVIPGQQPSQQQPQTFERGQPQVQQRNEGSVGSIQQDFPALSVSKGETPSPRAQITPKQPSQQPLQQPLQQPVQQPLQQSVQQQAQQSVKQTAPAKQESKGAPLQPTQFTLRKTEGSKGRRIKVDTNHMALSIKNIKDIYHYDVAFVPDKPKRLLRLVQSVLLLCFILHVLIVGHKKDFF